MIMTSSPNISIQHLNTYSPTYDRSFYSFLRRILWYTTCRWLVSSYIPGTSWRKFILRLFGAKIGAHGRIKPRLIITNPWLLTVGNHCWLGESLWIDNLAPVIIGDHVCISQLSYLCTGNHNYKKPTFDLILSSIVIESQAWIGARSTIAPGIHIGLGSVVSIGSVVTSSIPPLSIVKGNPAAYVGTRASIKT